MEFEHKGVKCKWFQEFDRIGGQQCGTPPSTLRLVCPEFQFEIKVGYMRSQIKQRNLALTLFELYLDEYRKA
jgi:hypothetical protein